MCRAPVCPRGHPAGGHQQHGDHSAERHSARGHLLHRHLLPGHAQGGNSIPGLKAQGPKVKVWGSAEETGLGDLDPQGLGIQSLGSGALESKRNTSWVCSLGQKAPHFTLNTVLSSGAASVWWLQDKEYEGNAFHTAWLDARIANKVKAPPLPWHIRVVAGAAWVRGTEALVNRHSPVFTSDHYCSLYTTITVLIASLSLGYT